eukprot:TRINITY_DN5733_c0_g2_i2.p1 TRINITY_DN5733_c0_g2~~TRINITY_DN5733_c0_g2_i2.p1  ORF type:complete len:117 (-),score=30.67 TRINITY_DN5733_c0_g2_i2:512-862(-)
MSGKGKGAKKPAGGSGSSSSKDELKTCNFVKARHILCEKQGKIMEVYTALQEEFLNDGNKVVPSRFGDLAQKYSECSSGKRGGDLGWFPRGKMEGKFQEIAFGLPVGACSEPFKGG